MVSSVSTQNEHLFARERGHRGLRALVLAYLVTLWIALALAAVALSSVVAGVVLLTAGVAHTAMTPATLRFIEQDLVGVMGALFSPDR
jgi:hypothetical protein